jgi:uncharacterized repeat protein (TIGR03803 family)
MRNKVSTVCRALTLSILAVLTTGAGAQSEKVIHSFINFGGADGNFPLAGLVSDAKGNLYGTASQGGSGTCYGCGIVFELSPGSGGTWTESILYTFEGPPGGDGSYPASALVFDGKGNLYGTTQFGGTSSAGTIFELTPGSGGTWTEKILYSFAGGSAGSYPGYSALAIDSSGNLYGTTSGGGTTNPTGSSTEFGNVFELVSGSNGTWTPEVLYNFKGEADGGNPFASTLAIDKAGNLYGVASALGAHDNGVVFKLTKGSNGSWSEKVLYAFPGGTGVSGPTGNLVFDTSGNIYGTAANIVFELVAGSNGTYTEKTLHTFTGGSDGQNVGGGLAVDKSGNLYGTANVGGSHRGTVFELTPGSGGTWTEKILHRFPPSPSTEDGIFPGYATLLLDATGNIYGTTLESLPDLGGVVFEITP